MCQEHDLSKEQTNLSQAKTILVTFLMQLGDIILTTPFLTALRRAAPQAKIIYLMDEKWLDILADNPDIDEILTIDRKGSGFSALWQYSASLRQREFDFLINLNPSERCTFLAAFSGAKYKTGTAHKLFKLFFDHTLGLNRQLHAADMYLDLLAQLGVSDLQHEGLKILASKEGQTEAEEFFVIENISDTDKVVGLNIGSALLAKRWSAEKFARVADALLTEGYKVIYFGSAGELAEVQQAVGKMKKTPIIATGKLSLPGLVAAIGRLDLFITNDSGPMHIAVSQKIPLIALYGVSDPDLYGPYTQASLVIKAPIPELEAKKRMKDRDLSVNWMDMITVEQVLAAARKILTEGKV